MIKEPLEIRTDPNPDADTSGADRGDDFKPTPEAKAADTPEPEPKADDTPAEEPARDDKGRFAKKPDEKKPAEEAKPEPEVEAEAAGEEEVEAEPAKPEKEKMVPLSRLNQVISQRNDAVNQLAEAKAENARLQKATNAELKEITDGLDALYEAAEKHRLDGDTKAAAKVARQIDEANRKIASIEAQQIAQRESVTTLENRTYDALLEHIEANVPTMDCDHEDFDRDVVKEFDLLVSSYENGPAKMAPTKALQKASVLLFGFDPLSKKKPAAAKEPEAEPEKKPAAPAAPKKKTTDVAKNMAAAAKTPPDKPGGPAPGEVKINVRELSEEEWDKLPASKKAELRGDFA